MRFEVFILGLLTGVVLSNACATVYENTPPPRAEEIEEVPTYLKCGRWYYDGYGERVRKCWEVSLE